MSPHLRARIMMVAAGILLALLLTTWAWSRLVAARQDLKDVVAACVRADRDADRLVRSRAGSGGLLLANSRDAEPVALVQSVTMQAGLPVTACAGIQPQGDVQVSPGVRRRTVRVQLTAITPQELGAWCLAWRRETDHWRIDACQLVHATPRAGLDSNRYDTSLTLIATLAEAQP